MEEINIYTDGAATMRKVNGEYVRCNGGAVPIKVGRKNLV